jgi:uncharacterized protein YjbI with pentapeptide repeats
LRSCFKEFILRKGKNALSGFTYLFISFFLKNDFHGHKYSQKHTEGIMICFRIIIAVLIVLATNMSCSRQHYIHLLKVGNVENWNKWRGKNTSVKLDLRRANLDSANLQGVDLDSAHLLGADLRGANLDSANLVGADLEKANLDSARLLGADLRGADLDSARLSETDLRGADLDNANLMEADLQGASLDSANLRGADLRVANFQGAILALARLEGVNLRQANLNSAHLWGADLKGADLKGTNLDSAYLLGADLRGADLGDINLGKVKTFYRAQLDPNVLSEIKDNWPEKLATVWDDTTKDWVIDMVLLAQVKKRDWHGWPEGKDQGK